MNRRLSMELLTTKKMKTMNRIIAAIALLMVSGLSYAQSTQSGFVKEYNERLDKTPLNLVEISISNAASTVSDDNGNFMLQFRTLKPGDKVNVRRIEKLGYEIFNKEALEQWFISRENRPFTIVMCKSEKFKRIRDNYSRVSSESYEKQLKKEEARLAAERKKGKLKEEEYQKALKKLNDDYDRQLDNLDNYVDRFARIDLSELSTTEAEIIELVQRGKIEKAIQLYEQQGLEEKYKQQVVVGQKATAAIDTLTIIRQQASVSRDSIFASIKRKNETLRLAGGKDNYDKIGQSLKEIAMADTSYYNAVYEYALFCLDTNVYDDAERYFKMCLGLTTDSVKLSDIYNRLGSICEKTNRAETSKAYFLSAMDLLKESNEKAKIGTLNNNLGVLFMHLRQFDDADSYFRKSITIREELLDTLNTESIYELACSYNNLGQLQMNLQRYDVSENLYTKALVLDSLLKRKGLAAYQRNHIGTTYNNVAVTYQNQANYPKAEYYYLKSIEERKEYIKEIPGRYLPDLIGTLSNLSVLYMGQNKLQEARAMAEDAVAKLAPLAKKFPEAYRGLSINCENNLANALNLLKDYPTAVVHYKKAIDNAKVLPPSRNRNYISGVLLGNFGAVQMYCKKYSLAESAYKESLSFFEQMMDKNPESVRQNVAMQQFNLGALYRLFLQDFENAEKYLLLSIGNYQSLNDAHPGTYNEGLVQSLAGLALLYARNDMIDKANNYYYRAYNILPDNSDVLDAKGVIEYMKGQIDKATETWEKKKSVDPTAEENSWLYELLFPQK